MKQMFRVLYSPKHLPQSRKREEAIFILFADFLDKCEGNTIYSAVVVSMITLYITYL